MMRHSDIHSQPRNRWPDRSNVRRAFNSCENVYHVVRELLPGAAGLGLDVLAPSLELLDHA